MSSENRFSAAAASLGYAYQFRYALLLALRRQQTGLDWAISIEAADDLEVSGSGDEALLQLKHRAKGTVLTDSSADLWKSLRVWSSGLDARSIRIPGTHLLLVTTAIVAPGSACADLARPPEERDNRKLAAALLEIAHSSTNRSLEPAISAYVALTDEQRTDLVGAVRVVAASPRIDEADDGIRSLARLMTRPNHVEPFIERLEGWWNRRCLRQLVAETGNASTGEEFDAFLTELREAFHADNLPIDDDIAADHPAVDAFLHQVFCRQLELVGLSVSRVLIAVRDYHRAFVQRSRWSHDGLLQYGELGRYERRLHEAWELLFQRTLDDLGPEPAEELKLRAAREIFAWAESADYPIRPACTEGFVSRGSLHILADGSRVGWHPDFELRLAEVLQDGASV